MPGVASLTAQQYYAHPRNAFWWIIEQSLGIDCSASYERRLTMLSDQGFLLWDVLQSCERPGSLDSAIAADSIQVNDFAALFSTYPGIKRVFLNGSAAFKLWQKRVAPSLESSLRKPAPVAIQLPSTSPAYAAMSREDKLERWRVIVASASD